MENKLEKLTELVNNYLELLDEEMHHGCYSTPEGIPYEFCGEEDYYERHKKIIDDVTKARYELESFMKKVVGK